MPPAKEEVCKLLGRLPDATSSEDIKYRIYEREKADQGRVERRVAKWPTVKGGRKQPGALMNRGALGGGSGPTAALVAVLLLMSVGSAHAEDAGSLEVGKANLSLGMRREKALQRLSRYSLRKVGEGDYWLISTTPDSPAWIGAIQFEDDRLRLVLKNLGHASNEVMHTLIGDLLRASGGTCRFTLAQQPGADSPLRVTLLDCGKKKVAIQAAHDEKLGLFPCNIESLGDPGGRFASLQFWQSCLAAPGHEGSPMPNTPHE